MNITIENYFSKENQLAFMGATQFKHFCQCEAMALAEVKGEWSQPVTKDLLIGQYIDNYFSNTLDIFKSEHPELFTKQGELKCDYQNADKIIARISRDSVFLADCTGQQQVIMTGLINGVPYKIMIDSLHQNYTVDRKIMRDCCDMWQDGEYKPFWKAWGYDIQAAIYQEIRSQNDWGKKPFMLAVATKENEPDLRRFLFSDETLSEAYEDIYNLSPRFQKIKQGLIEPTRCGCCDYCKSTKVLKESDIEVI